MLGLEILQCLLEGFLDLLSLLDLLGVLWRQEVLALLVGHHFLGFLLGGGIHLFILRRVFRGLLLGLLLNLRLLLLQVELLLLLLSEH